jgi:hypothetical protein
VDVALTLTVTVLVLEFVSSRFMAFNSGFGVGKAHMIIAVVDVIGGGRTVMSVSVVVTVSTSYSTKRSWG